MKLIEGKVAIVTGSGRGIGRAVAELFARHGARVVVNDLDRQRRRGGRRGGARTTGGEALVCAGSVTDPEFPNRLIKTTVDHFKALDIIVNNAGYTYDGVIHKMSRRAVVRDDRLPPHRPVPHPARRVALLARLGQAGEGGGQARHPPRGQHLVDLRRRRQRRAGELLGRQDGHRRRHQDAGQGMGPAEHPRQRRRLRLHRDPPDRRQGQGAEGDASTATRSRSAFPIRCARWPSR